VPVLPRPPTQASSTRSFAACFHASRRPSWASWRSVGSRKSGQRTHRDSHETGSGRLLSRYTPNSGRAPFSSGRFSPRPRTSRPEGRDKIPGAPTHHAAHARERTAVWYSPVPLDDPLSGNRGADGLRAPSSVNFRYLWGHLLNLTARVAGARTGCRLPRLTGSV